MRLRPPDCGTLVRDADLVRAALIPFVVVGSVLIWRTGRFVAGRLLILIGSLHCAGAIVGRAALGRIITTGFVGEADSALGQVSQKADQELLFWFLLWGAVTVMLGQAIVDLQRRGEFPRRVIGYELIAVNVVCCLLMPKAGFWWVLIPGWLIARRHPDDPRIV
jgi:Family of unknown function (DUF6463)